jgi:hypothetical protein
VLQGVDYRNSWIVAVDRAERHVPLWGLLLYGVGVFAAAWFAAQASVPLAMDAAGEAVGSVAAAVFFAVLLAGGLVGSRLVERRAALEPTRSGRRLGLGLTVGAAALAAAVGLCATAGVLESGEGVRGAAAGLAASTALILLGAVAEEAFFRGWLQPVLSARLGPWIGVGVTALLFSSAHLIGQAFSGTALLNGVLAGTVFGVLALRTASLAAPVAAHFAWNWLEIVGLGLFPNPGVDALGALADFELAGSALWTGGAPGLNGSLATTIALGLACAGLILPVLPGLGRR